MKVGDKVIGKPEADLAYAITRKGWEGKITRILSDSSVEIVHISGGAQYEVNPEYFFIYDKDSPDYSVF